MIDSRYALYSNSSLSLASNIKINSKNIVDGTTVGTAGLNPDGTVTTSSINIPGLDPASFPSNTATTDLDEANSPLNANTAVFYDQVNIGTREEFRFTGSGPFHINTLTVEDDADVYFSAGTYYINTLILRDTTHLRLDAGPVNLHIGNSLDLNDRKIHINEHDGGEPEDLRIYLHTNASITNSGSNDDNKIKAIIIGVNNGPIKFGPKLSFDGVILSDNDITIDTKSRFDLNSSMQSVIGAISTCDTAGSVVASISSISVVPGANAIVSITLSGTSASDTVFSYTTQDGTATAGSDYTAKTGSITISAGNTSAQITINTSATAQTGEAFSINLSSSDVSLNNTSATATFSAPAGACSLIDSRYGLYSTVGLNLGSGITINNNGVASGNAMGTSGLDPNGSIITSSISVPGFDPVNFPANNSTTNLDDTNSPLTDNSAVFYDLVRVNDNKELQFTGSGPFHINTLIVEDDADVYFSAGIYYIDTLILRDTTHIRLNNGPVQLHIGSELDLDDRKIHINEHDGGEADDLRIYLHENATVTDSGSNDDNKIKAIFIGNNNGPIQFGSQLKFEGLIISENTITVGNDADLELDSTLKTAIDAVTTCDAAGTLSLSISSVSMMPGNDATFSLALSATTGTDIVINYATQDGTATAGSDYTSDSGTVTIAAGSLTTLISINTSSTATVGENFSINLTSNDVSLSVATALASFTGAAGACGLLNSTYGLYSTTSLALGTNTTINTIAVTSGTTSGSVGLDVSAAITATSISIPGLDPSGFPTNSSTTDIDETSSPIDGTTEKFFDEVVVNDNQVLTFNGNGPFHIKTLTIEDDADVYLSAGTYYIDTLILRDTTHIRLSNAPVALHIGTELNLADQKIHINEHEAGSPENLLIYLHANAVITGGASNTEAKIRAVIVGVDNGVIDFGDKLKFSGIILSENDLTFGSDAAFTLNTANQNAINNRSTCLITDFSTFCGAVFTAGLQISNSDGTVEFEASGQLLANPSSVLITPSINKNHSSSCDTTQCTAGENQSEAPIFPTFLTSSTTTDLDISSDQTIGNSGVNAYRTVTVRSNQSLDFSTAQSSYIIDTLTVENSGTVNFVAGDYYIADLKTDNSDLTLNVVGPGTVRIYSTADIKFKNNAIVNSPSAANAGTASVLYVHSQNNLKIESGATITGFLVAQNDFEAKGSSTVFGAVSAGEKIKLKDTATLTYINNEITSTDFGASCSQIDPANSLNYFTLNHDGNGINCVSETLVITARKSSGDIQDSYAETVTLDTQSSKGSWSLVAGNGTFLDATNNDGLASYSYSDLDDGIASFGLNYSEGAASLDVDIFQTSNSTLRDDDSEATLTFNPSGFSFTQSVLTNPPPTPINDPLITQTAGSEFNLHITAFGQTADDPDCGIIEAYTSDQSIAFWADYENPTTGTLTPTINSTIVATNQSSAAGQTINFSNGQAMVLVKYKDVGQIQLHGQDLAQTGITGATNIFLVKPSDLIITEIKTALGSSNPGATSATGNGFVAAGEAFTVVVEARDAENAVTPNFGRELVPEGIEITSTALVIPAGGINGSANDGKIGNSSAFSATAIAGVFAGNNFSFDEYGIITLQASIADDDYLGGGEISGSVSGNVGRFYPASFTLDSSSVVAACNNFTYMDQPEIMISYNLQALDTLGAQLSNYDAGLLGSSAVAIPVFHIENDNQGVDLSSRLAVTSSTWVNGSYQLTNINQQFNRATSPDGPFTSLQLGVSITDNLDTLKITNANMNPSTSNDCTAISDCDTRALSGTTNLHYGRMVLSNAFGPETEPLAIPLSTQYFTENGNFVENTNDDCSAYINSASTLSNYQDGLGSLSIISPTSFEFVVNGSATPGNRITLSAPGANNTGSVDISYSVPAWLKYNWQGSGDEDPQATASYGHFRGHDKVIYWREVF
ncbi:MAG: hypothetical protein KUG79_08795 [Pseudomonadales bacterium]|nr:hypothetical protein [Pseudomonadales bacterium]